MTVTKPCSKLLFGIGAVFVILGLSFGLYGRTFFSNWYHNELQLSPSSSTYKFWVHTPLPLYLEVYLFNWTNAEDFVRNKSVTPVFEEVGPFVFQEVHDRVNIIWNENDTVTYNQTRKWTFVPERSEDLSIEITNLNVVAVTLSQQLKNFKNWKWVINLELNLLEDFIVTAPAENWLFDAIDDKVLDFLNIVEDIFKIHLKNKKFGWFYGRNMSSSYDGIFTVKTGAKDIYELGMMDNWNRVKKTEYYKGQCGMVNGTSGELFPPMDSIRDNITLFISDICSSITLNYNGSSSVKGIHSHKYVGVETTWDNGQFFPENKCFCGDECAPYGARNVSACHTAPLYFSFPHFYKADESYRSKIIGMNPNKSEHEFMIQIDPVTGVPTNVNAQLQINVLLEPVSWINMFKDVPKIFMPMMWFREKATITTELAGRAILLELVPLVVMGLCYTIIIIGVLIIAIRLWVIYRKKDKDCELLIPPVMSEDDDERVK